MKIIDLEQGSPEWLLWRKTVITATDCSCIMGSNPWTSEYECWQRKMGYIPEKKKTAAMQRGIDLEPIARMRFVECFGVGMTPRVVESSEYSFLGASLDGLSDCGNYILEIKTGNDELRKEAVRGEIPEYYMHQMQHQLLVTGAKYCAYYVAHEDEDKDITFRVLPDPEFKDKFLPKAREFLRRIAFNEPPPLSDSDYRDISEEPNWRLISEKYKEVCEEIKKLESHKELYRQDLIRMCGGDNCMGCGVKAMKVTIKGRIDYESMPQLKDVDIEPYRKPSTQSWKICTS